MGAEYNKLAGLFSPGKEYYERLLKESFPDISLVMSGQNPVVIYGAAKMGRLFYKNLSERGIPVKAFADGNPALWGSSIEGVQIVSPEGLRALYYNSPVLVASLLHESEIYHRLLEMGLPLVYPLCFLNFNYPDIFASPLYFNKFHSLFEESAQLGISEAGRLWADKESRDVYYNILRFRLTFNKGHIHSVKSDPAKLYFETELLGLSEESFLDCGAYTGDTLEAIQRGFLDKFKKIYAFEPDRQNFLSLCANIKEKGLKAIAVNAGVYNSSGAVSFSESGSDDACVDEAGPVSLQVFSIDDFVKDKETPTYIKLDIEGSETEALSGAKETLKAHKPKLAVSVYHKDSDLWKIPLLIRQLNSGYSLYLRHYSYEIEGTVCYAV